MKKQFGILCLFVILLLMALEPLLSSHDPLRTDLLLRLRPPGGEHWLGTDNLGRDVLARLGAGARHSLWVALLALAILSTIGVVVGSAAAMLGRATDVALSAGTDLLLSIPRFVLILNAAAVLTLSSPVTLAVLIGLTSWMRTARIVRTEVLSLRGRLFVEAAIVAGAGRWAVLTRHILPHLARLLAASANLRLTSVILLATGLDYLGLGPSADLPTLGRMVRDGQIYVGEAPWIAFSSIGALSVTTVGLALVADEE